MPTPRRLCDDRMCRSAGECLWHPQSGAHVFSPGVEYMINSRPLAARKCDKFLDARSNRHLWGDGSALPPNMDDWMEEDRHAWMEEDRHDA